MGTSSSYGGPTGRISLLPPWAEEIEGDALPENEEAIAADPLDPPVVTWAAPKRAVIKLSRGGPGGASMGTFRSLSKSYVRASGGARTASSAARSGRAVTSRLGGFLAAGIRDGFGQTAERFGLQMLVGQDAQSVLAAFVDLLAPDGALLEEAASRTALIDTLQEMFVRYEVEAVGLEALDRMDATTLGETVELYVVNYVNARIQQELVNRIERNSIPEMEANRLMDEIRGFIQEIVKLDFAEVELINLDWEGLGGYRLVEGVYEEAYRLLGGEE